VKETITILVVDDEVVMRSLLEKILSRDGYNIMTAEDGEEALRVIENNKVDIVISDVNMPKLDGFGLLKKVRQEHDDITMIMMTAYGDTYTVKDALLLGADEYITKPFKNYEISLIVERVYWRITSSEASHQIEDL
jgi:two-component system response regulator PilR (NtrC family)